MKRKGNKTILLNVI